MDLGTAHEERRQAIAPGANRPALLTRVFRVCRRKYATWARLSRFVQAWFVPTWLLLGLGRAALILVPFGRLAPHLGQRVDQPPDVPPLDVTHGDLARRIGEVVRLAARYAPWTANCLPQAIAARLLLAVHRLPSTVYFGVVRDAEAGGGLAAHAWVVSGSVPVVGTETASRYAVVGCFVSPPPRSTTKPTRPEDA